MRKKFISLHPATVLFILMTLIYGITFIIMTQTHAFGVSSLYVTMHNIDTRAPLMWGIVAIVTAMLSFTEYRGIAAMLGFMVWLFAAICYGLLGDWLLILALTLVNMLFWLLFYNGRVN